MKKEKEELLKKLWKQLLAKGLSLDELADLVCATYKDKDDCMPFQLVHYAWDELKSSLNELSRPKILQIILFPDCPLSYRTTAWEILKNSTPTFKELTEISNGVTFECSEIKEVAMLLLTNNLAKNAIIEMMKDVDRNYPESKEQFE